MIQPVKSFLHQTCYPICMMFAVMGAACIFTCRADARNVVTEFLTLQELLKKWEPVPLAEIQHLAENGDASAQHYLGYCHAEGLRVSQNPAEGASWYRRALQADYLPSANNLGFLHQRGLLGTIDYAKAVEYYRYAAERGLAQSQMNMGVMYRDGMGVDADPKEGLKWFRLAAAQGHPIAMVEVGRSYRFGRGVEVDSGEAVRWFERAVNEKNSSLARLNLGLLFQDSGEIQKAVSYYQQAADAGETEAMVQLYCCYWEGNGVATDHAKAMDWLKKAAEAKNAYAEYLMGYQCERVEWMGEGRDRYLTMPNYQGAVRWYRRSAEHGWAGGQYHLGLMYLEGKAVSVDETRALELIRAAAAQNLKDALQKLAQLYASGIGEPRNVDERPVALLERAEAWKDLMFRYEHGLGTERDLVMAARSYTKLVLHGGWNYSQRNLSEMIEFKSDVGGSSASWLIDPVDRHLAIRGPQHRGNADCSDDVLRMLSPYLKSARGEGAAAFRIGELYEKGQSVPKSVASAWSWFSIAAQNGNSNAREKILLLEKQMSADELKITEKRLSEIRADLKEVAAVLQ